MLLTVAICTWNRSQLLRATLQQLTHLVVPEGTEWELLVVDNNSADDTRIVLEEFISRHPDNADVRNALEKLSAK